MSSRKCDYCGTLLVRFAKDDTTGKWKKWDSNNNEHTYQACKAIQNNKGQQQQAQTPIEQTTIDNTQMSRLLFSQQNTINVLKKQNDEFSRQLGQAIGLIEQIYQQNTLIIKQTGYPTPKTIEAIQGLSTRKPKISEGLEQANADMVKNMMKEKPEQFLPQQSGEVIHPEDINIPQTMVKSEEEEKHTDKELDEMMESDAQAMELMEKQRKELEEKPAVEIQEGWTLISQKFNCDSCHTFTHNGFEKYNTMLCSSCLEEIRKHEKTETE